MELGTDLTPRERRAIVIAAACVRALVLACLLAPACSPVAPRPAPAPANELPPSSFGVEAGAGACENACARLAALHCPEGQPTKAGTSCAAVCARGERLEGLPTACVAGATSVPAVRACGVRCLD
jgi:hypothetical protein